MLFWLFIIFFIVSLIATTRVERHTYSEGGYIFSAIATFLFGFAIFISAVVIIGNLFISEADLITNKTTYESLCYKAETEAIRDEFGIVNKEYIDEIQNWNVELAKHKELQRNFWVGIYYPNIYDELEFINLYDIKTKE